MISADWVLPVDAPPIADGAVVIEDGRIAAIGTAAELGSGHHYADAAIIPGLVNCHTHLEYAVYAGFGDALDFGDWLQVHIARKRRLDWDDTVAIARLGAAECLTSGVTTVGDASYSGAAAVACAELGLRAIVHLEVFGAGADGLARFDELHARIEGSLSDRVRLGISPHAPYTVGVELYRAAAGLALPTATHLSESPAELEWLVDGTGPWQSLREFLQPPLGESGIRRLARAGLLGPRLVAAHCVQVDAEEIELLRAADVAVAHCPRSNALLGCGAAPLTDLLAAGIRVGLGTDSPASTPSFDMFDELRTAVLTARARQRRPDALTATEALALATLGSASALGLDGEIGSLTPGKRADIAVVGLAGSPYHPWEDPAAAVVFGGSPQRVLATVVGGDVRYAPGELRWREVQQTATRSRSLMLRRQSTPPRGVPPLPSR